MLFCREKTPDDRLTPVPDDCSDWLESDDGEEPLFRDSEQIDNLDQLTLAERLAIKRKPAPVADNGMIFLWRIINL